MQQRRRPITIAVAGGTGSGKTTIAMAILDRVGSHNIAFVPHDVYYKNFDHLPAEELSKVNYDHPDSLETSLMREHILELQAWQPVEIPTYDYARYRRKAEVQVVNPQPIILVEGILILAETVLRPLFDVKIYVDADPDIRFIRRLQRDIAERGRNVESVIGQYMTTVRPMHLEFVEPSKRYADVIIPEGGSNTVAIDMVSDRIRTLLQTATDPS